MSASTARTPPVSTYAPQGRCFEPSSAPSWCRRTSATAAATVSRPARSASSTSVRRRESMEVYPLLRPHQRRPRASLRASVPHELDPVRPFRRAQGEGERPPGDARRGRGHRCEALRCRRGRVRHGRLLPPPRRSRGLRHAARPRSGDEKIREPLGASGSSGRSDGPRHCGGFHWGCEVTVDRPDLSVSRDSGDDYPSYYGRPVIKEPVWSWEIPWYFFTGGLAGASSCLGFVAGLTGNRWLGRTARLVSLGAAPASPILLISDLGRPDRFYNMLRVFKPTSPMSVGTWVLSSFGAASSIA